MYFTNYIEGQLNAVYNGRFAFVPGVEPDSVRIALDQFKLEAPATDAEVDPRLKAALAEELFHSRLFLLTRTGLLLVGLRWFARLFWGAFRSPSAVDWYYRLRAIYFVHSYTRKERAVAALFLRRDALLRTAAKRRLTAKEIGSSMALLADLDRDVVRSWRTRSSVAARTLLTLAGPVLRWMGRQAAAYPTFIVQRPVGSDSLAESNVSLGGFVNTAAWNGNRNATLAERIAGFFSIERWAANRAGDDWNWTLIKFQAERSARPLWAEARQSEISRGIEPRPWATFEEYVDEMALFVSNWAHVRDPNWPWRLADAISALVKTHSEDWLRLSRDLLGLNTDERKAKAVNFFFLHGN